MYYITTWSLWGLQYPPPKSAALLERELGARPPISTLAPQKSVEVIE